jgi:hypothetical protein
MTPRAQHIAQSAFAFATCSAGLVYFAHSVNAHYPLRDWLAWRILPVLGYALLFNVACVSFGALLVDKLLGEREVHPLERLLYAMAAGLTGFALCMYALGFAALFRPLVALLLPFALLAAGQRQARSLAAALWAWRESLPAPSRLGRVLAACVLGLGALFVGILYIEQLDVSKSFNHDGAWYHIPTAQDYARLGRIVPFPGENHRAYPHLTSLLQTWALLVPGLRKVQQHWMLCLHLEFFIVLWRIVSVAALARFMLYGRDVRGLWVGFFLFSSIFIADQAVGGGADHQQGFYAGPIALATAQVLRRFDLRWCVLLGVLLGGHTLVKYQAIYMVFAVTALVVVRASYLLVRALRERRRSDSPPGVILAPRLVLLGSFAILLSASAVSAPHFVKNIAFYGNPVYPFAQSTFTASHPKSVPGYYKQSAFRRGFAPRYEGLRRQLWVATKVFDYSFVTANRDSTQNRPYMGSLFTILLPCLVLFRKRRILLVTGLALLAFWVWANTAANDRYLLSFYDLMIAVALVLLVHVWELGWAARAALIPLVAFQFLWGGDAMLTYGRHRLRGASELMLAGYQHKSDDERFAAREDQQRVTKATPPDAVIFARNFQALLGLDRTVYSDVDSATDYTTYSHVRDPRQLYDQLRSRGVTHLLYPPGDRKPARWNNTVLFGALFQHTDKPRRIGTLMLGEMPKQPPPSSVPFLVAVAGIRGYPDGIYRVEQLDIDEMAPEIFTPKPRPHEPFARDKARLEEQLSRVSALALRRGRGPALRGARAFGNFRQVESWGSDELYLRRPRP